MYLSQVRLAHNLAALSFLSDGLGFHRGEFHSGVFGSTCAFSVENCSDFIILPVLAILR